MTLAVYNLSPTEVSAYTFVKNTGTPRGTISSDCQYQEMLDLLKHLVCGHDE